MEFYEKKVKYFKFFEDIKVMEIDHEMNRLAVIFYGKESLIHIFDTTPYLNYSPVLEKEEPAMKGEKANKKKKTKVDNKDDETKKNKDGSSLSPAELQSMFHQLHINNNDECGKTIITQNQEYIIFNHISSQKGNGDTLFSQKKEFKVEHVAEVMYEAVYKSRKVKLDLYKPNVRPRLLSVITSPSNVIIGTKWFTYNGDSANGHGLENKIKPKHLLSVNEDGNAIIYHLQFSNPIAETLVDLNRLQSNPFQGYPEQWKSCGNIFTGKPIRDYYIESKPKRLYTLHVDNFILVWVISYVNNKLTFMANYTINLTNNISINKILVDKCDNFIYTFHNNNFKIFKVMNKPPFPIIYSCNLDEICGKFVEKTVEQTKSKGKNISKISNGNLSTKSNLNFITEGEDYEICYNDLIDRSQSYKMLDINFFNNMQKPEFTLLEEYILIPHFLADCKTYVLLKFKNKTFVSKILKEEDFFKQCILGKIKSEILIDSVKVSNQPIKFGYSPSFAYEQEKINIDEIINIDDILSNYYQPIILMYEGIVNIINLHSNQIQATYSFKNKKIINPEFALVLWTHNNTILISSIKIHLNLIKFCKRLNSKNHLKFLIPLNAEKIDEFYKLK